MESYQAILINMFKYIGIGSVFLLLFFFPATSKNLAADYEALFSIYGRHEMGLVKLEPDQKLDVDSVVYNEATGEFEYTTHDMKEYEEPDYYMFHIKGAYDATTENPYKNHRIFIEQKTGEDGEIYYADKKGTLEMINENNIEMIDVIEVETISKEAVVDLSINVE